MTLRPMTLLAVSLLAQSSLPALCAEGAPAAPALPASAQTDADYVLSGAFAKEPGKFRATDFVRVVSALPAVKAKDPKLYGDLEAALKRYAGDAAGPLESYLADYRASACRARHVDTNIDVADFQEFSQRLLASRDLALACAAMKGKDFQAAVRQLDATLGKDPRFAAAYLNRAVAKASLQDAVGASQDYTESQKTPLGSEAPPKDCLCDPALEGEASRLKSAEAASAEAKKRATSSFEAKDYAAAVAALDEASKADPGDPETRMSRAVAREKLGDPEKAKADYGACSTLGVSAARWDLAADCVLNVARLERSHEGLAFAGKSLDYILKNAPKEWPRREALLAELAALNRRAGLVPSAQPPGRTRAKRPAPGAPPGVVPDKGEPQGAKAQGTK